MINPADIRAIAQNLVAWVISLLISVAALVLWPSLDNLGDVRQFKISLSTGQIVMSGISVFCVLAVPWILLHNNSKRAVTYLDRETVMQRNAALVRIHCTDSADDFLSTRVTSWDLSEESRARREFRAQILDKIASGHLVKRLWHLRSVADLDRMEEYLKEYKKFDNYNLRFLIDLSPAIPEIICIGRKGAAFSFPELRSPRKISLGIQFYRKAEVDAVRKYFDVLWESATPVKTGSTINYQVLSVARQTLSTPGATSR
ncbi:hypothetical protein [Caballeronia sp. LZ032]|uniref:hypothetical protein n=1 Tax=Caballeronia sp. LZ032 TaxID=3038565 RepID=UPI0028572FB5|nr:hypothetical protein [Caballeronia sp. LZ032]MDR5878797.1 hypothetical protein [Caballeronia sp. LZ032]